MNRGPRLRNRNVTINEEDEEEKIKKTEAKKAIIRAEFEKHKKELKLNVSDASKINEIKLKNQLEELLTANNRKRENRSRLQVYESNLERENLEATMFYQTVNRGNRTRNEGENSAYLTVGFHPNRTTSDIFGMAENGTAEALSEKKLDLQETLSNIELLTEQEGEILSSLQERLEEAKKNKLLLSKRRNDLQKMNEHADKRFFDLKRIDFLARNKEAATTSHLKELRDNITGLQKQESTFKKQKDEDHDRETKYVINKQNEMAGVLIELDQKRLELQAKQETLRKLELEHEEMKDKRKTTRIVTKYIQTFAALEEPKTNLLTAHFALKELLERQDSAKSIDYGKRGGSPTGQDKHGSLNSSMKDSSVIRRLEEEGGSPMKKNSFAERNFYIDQIQTFYENHPEGPDQHVNKLIEQYDDFSFREQSLKSNYEEIQDYKAKKQNELKALRAELKKIKSKNHYITLGRTGSKIIESNEHEAIDSGMLKVKTEATTINQAKFEYENKRDADNFVTLYTTTETFVLRCYLDSVEMMSRLSKVLSSIYHQSEHSSGGGFMSDELREIAKRIKNNISSMKKIKRGKQDPHSHSMLDAYPELQRTHTNNTSASDKDQDIPSALDLNEVYEMFLSIFGGHEDKASEFISKLKADVLILSFINIDEIRAYLMNFQNEFYMDREAARTIQEVESMREQAVENMVQKFDMIFKLYCDLSDAATQAIEEADDFVRSRGIVPQTASQQHLHSRNNSETNGFVKGALDRKWSSLKSKYEYDPTRDYRRDTRDTETGDSNPTPRPKLAVDEAEQLNKANWDSEDLKAKISEIVVSRVQKAKADFSISGQAPVYRGKNEEDQKRLQMKKDKEKQKQAIENMTDEDFLEYQRKQIKEVKEENIHEIDENELFRKAQADQVSRLSQKVPIEELRRMIDNSKVLSKIQILERKKGTTDGKKDFKQNTVENYIPPEPKKFPKSSLHVTTAEFKFRIERNAFTPNMKQTHSRLFNLHSDRSDYEDSPKDVSIKGSSFKSASRFKPREGPLFDLNTEPTVVYDNKPQTAGGKRLTTIDSFKSRQKTSEVGMTKMPFLSETTTPHHAAVVTEDFVRRNKLVIQTARKRLGGDQTEPQSAKHKSTTGLPKLEKQGKKKKDVHSKKRRKNNHSQKIGNDGENLNALFSLQTDPLLKMVYSPSFFTTSFPTTTIGTDLDYKFDSYKFQAPSLLIAEKL